MARTLNHSQDIIELIKKIRGFNVEYPSELLSVRRVSFISMISRYIVELVRS
jgi:hypothetical protein